MIRKLMMMGLALLSLAACSNQTKQSNSSAAAATSSAQVTTKGQGKLVENTSQLSQEDQNQIIQSYEDFCQALIDKDMDKIDQMLPDNFVAVHITGKRQSKEEWLADIENGEMNYFEFLDVTYKLTSQGENKATLDVTQRIHAKIYGSEGTWSIPGSWTYEKKDGQWQLVV